MTAQFEYMPQPAARTVNDDGPSRRWTVILAGGEGKRLLPLTRKIVGDHRPKQFCAIVDGETLLDRTRPRVRRSPMSRH